MTSKAKATPLKIGRDAGTGLFIPVEQARRMGNRAVVETIKRPVATPVKPGRK